MNGFIRLLKLLTICLCTGIIFVGTGYLYLDKKLEPTENKTSSVPYSKALPENAGVKFEMCGKGLLVYMNFEENQLSFIFDDKGVTAGGMLYGYSVDYIIEGELDLLAGIIDILGGIELESKDEILRYTGVQVSDMLSRQTNSDKLIREIILKLTQKIQKTGFKTEDFLYIINNSNTNLTVPDCYYWSEYISALCSDVQIVN